MTEHDDKQATRVDTVASVAPSKGRRRLVKGVLLATPAIVTLRTSFASQNSGPSIEKALASLTCDENGTLNSTPALLSFINSGGDITGITCPEDGG